jgi:hypothetical protein
VGGRGDQEGSPDGQSPGEPRRRRRTDHRRPDNRRAARQLGTARRAREPLPWTHGHRRPRSPTRRGRDSARAWRRRPAPRSPGVGGRYPSPGPAAVAAAGCRPPGQGPRARRGLSCWSSSSTPFLTTSTSSAQRPCGAWSCAGRETPGALQQWIEEVRPRFGAGKHPALWVTERAGRMSLRGERLSGAVVSTQVGHAYASTTAIFTGVSDEYRNRLLTARWRAISSCGSKEHRRREQEDELRLAAAAGDGRPRTVRHWPESCHHG